MVCPTLPVMIRMPALGLPQPSPVTPTYQQRARAWIRRICARVNTPSNWRVIPLLHSGPCPMLVLNTVADPDAVPDFVLLWLYPIGLRVEYENGRFLWLPRVGCYDDLCAIVRQWSSISAF